MLRFFKSIGKGIVNALPLSGIIKDVIDNRQAVKRVVRSIKDKGVDRAAEKGDLYLLFDLLDDGSVNDSYDRQRSAKIIELVTALLTVAGAAAFLFG